MVCAIKDFSRFGVFRPFVTFHGSHGGWGRGLKQGAIPFAIDLAPKKCESLFSLGLDQPLNSLDSIALGMVLYLCPFEIGLCSGKGGRGRLARVETGLLSRTLPIGTKEQTAAHRRDALCPSTKIQKQAAFGIICWI